MAAASKSDVIERSLKAAGKRISRKMSYMQRTKDVLTMTNVEQVRRRPARRTER